MKTFVKILALISFICLTTMTNAQQTRFIELTVTDTISLQTTQIVYQINLGQQVEFMGMKIPLNDKEEEVAPARSINEITSILDKGKFNYSINNTENYTISDPASQPSIDVTLKSESELKNLYEVLKDEQGITGKIKDIAYEPVSKYYTVFYSDLYAKAKNQATLLASISGNTLGALISASDIQSLTDSYGEMYSQMMKNFPMGIMGDQQVASKNEKVKMTFRFELK